MLQSYTVLTAIYRTILGLLGWLALVIQFCIMRSNGARIGLPFSVWGINFLSYFTILTNVLVAFSLSAALFSSLSRAGAFFSRATVQTAILGNIVVVGCVYNLILARLWNPQGLQWTVDVLLHSVIPLLYLLYWVLFVPKGTLTFTDPFPWLIYPFLYLLYSLARGAMTGWYPYPFVDAAQFGYGTVCRNSLLLLLVFLGLFYLLVLVDRWMGRKYN